MCSSVIQHLQTKLLYVHLFDCPITVIFVEDLVWLYFFFLGLFLVKENMKSMAEQRTKNLKVLQEKMKLNQKEVKRFNPVSSYLIPFY